MRSERKARFERIVKNMKISPFKKLEWLNQMREFTLKFYSKRQKKLWMKFRESR